MCLAEDGSCSECQRTPASNFVMKKTISGGGGGRGGEPVETVGRLGTL